MTFKVLLHHYGSFTSPPGRKFVDGIVATVDPVELNNFSTNQMKAILTKCLGYDENSSTFLYMKKPNRSLDSGLVLLDDAIQDIDSILTYIQTYQNLLHVYVSRVELSPFVVADQLEDGVVGNIQIYVSHHPIYLSMELIPNDGSLEEAYADITDDEDVKIFVGCASNSTDDGIPNLYVGQPTRTQPRIIPGPAGILQRAMLRKNADVIEVGHENVMPTQEYVRKISENVSEDDHFTLGPWVSAIVYLHGEGVIPSGCLGDMKKIL
ncbi:hypothetical protein Tco_1294708 [Tanacetum coccineum]